MLLLSTEGFPGYLTTASGPAVPGVTSPEKQAPAWVWLLMFALCSVTPSGILFVFS